MKRLKTVLQKPRTAQESSKDLTNAYSLCSAWHELGREHHERNFPNLPYDTDSPHYVVEQGNVAFFLEGNGGEYAPSVVFAVELGNGKVYPVNRIGLIERDQYLGEVAELTGQDLEDQRLR